jgi:hypothetical protein
VCSRTFSWQGSASGRQNPGKTPSARLVTSAARLVARLLADAEVAERHGDGFPAGSEVDGEWRCEEHSGSW